MRALITGISGFVGQYLANELSMNGYEVYGGTRKSSPFFSSGSNTIELDYTRQDKLIDTLQRVRPDIIFHLSGQSSVKYSWDNIQETFQSNIMDSIALFEAVKSCSLSEKIKIISVGSSEEYGYVNHLPIVENASTNPLNPYGLSKLTVGKLAQQYGEASALNIIHARAFNHIGPGQMLGFVTSDFAKQIVDIELQGSEPIIYVGDLSSKRDFTDVRDIVRAYRLLAEKGDFNQIYNVCSGTCVAISEILTRMVSFASSSIEVKVDPTKLRPVNVKEYYGSNEKITKTTGWVPTIPLEQSLNDIYHYWKSEKS